MVMEEFFPDKNRLEELLKKEFCMGRAQLFLKKKKTLISMKVGFMMAKSKAKGYRSIVGMFTKVTSKKMQSVVKDF